MTRIFLVGPAASGKDYFREFLHNKGKRVDVSYTTRPARDGEIPGYTYHYISDSRFQNMVLGESMHEHVEFNGWQYGTSRESWEESEVFIMTPSGIKQISEEDLRAAIVVYFDIPVDVRLERLEKRSDADSAERRLAADEADFAGFDKYDLKVTNPTFDCETLYYVVKTMRLL